ncbi:hypothetical protein TREES_T100003223 [Tupaia chinensis]|uniref:Uncharacterized protein n=1 Tax=Tupaia chinensis TaxID=246437 RepID=L9K3P2_TUPCH|nr:hypothetical protein TREES_T100003223 [Tupaia chinensis]
MQELGGKALTDAKRSSNSSFAGEVFATGHRYEVLFDLSGTWVLESGFDEFQGPAVVFQQWLIDVNVGVMLGISVMHLQIVGASQEDHEALGKTEAQRKATE